jgi:putative oxidoreductase
MQSLLKIRSRLLALADKAKWLGPTLARLTLGLVFATTGWGKLHNLDQVTEFFTSLHLPAPHFQATLVASTEFLGGLAILTGLATRLAAAPLAFTMIVAILTAKRDELTGITSLVGFEEFTYLVMFLWLIVAGPGPLSIDRLISRRLDSRRASRPRVSQENAALVR